MRLSGRREPGGRTTIKHTGPPQADSERADSGRNDGLDLIRVTGAFLVFATHLYFTAGQTWLGPIAAGGYVGVYLFFPLSGYLLYRPFTVGQVDLRRYAKHRVARLAPLYFLVVAVLLVGGLEPHLRTNPWPTLLVVPNVFEPPGTLTVFDQSWSLGVEVTFYAVLPLLALLRPSAIILLMGMSFVFSAWFATGDWWFRQLPTMFWSFGFGMLVARYQHQIPNVARAWPLGLALLLIGVLAAARGRGDFATVIGAAVLILWAAVRRPSIPGVRLLAKISYGVYLWHVAVLSVVARTLDGPLLVLVVVPVVCGIATLSYVLVERPPLTWVRGRSTRAPREAAVAPA